MAATEAIHRDVDDTPAWRAVRHRRARKMKSLEIDGKRAASSSSVSAP